MAQYVSHVACNPLYAGNAPEDTFTKKSTNETYMGRNRAPSHGEAQESKVNGEPHGCQR